MPEQRLDGHRRRHARGPHQPVGVGQQQGADRAHHLRPVEEREALLRLEDERLEAGRRERLGRPARPSPSTSTSPRPMSGSARWASGARSPDAPTLPCSGTTGWMPFASSARIASTTTGRQPLWPSARVFARSRSIARTISRGNGAPDAGRVAHQQVLLELAGLRAVDERGREIAEAGRHAVDHGVLRDQALDDVARLLHPLARVDVERGRRAVPGDRFDIGDGQVRAGQDRRARTPGPRRPLPRSGTKCGTFGSVTASRIVGYAPGRVRLPERAGPRPGHPDLRRRRLPRGRAVGGPRERDHPDPLGTGAAVRRIPRRRGRLARADHRPALELLADRACRHARGDCRSARRLRHRGVGRSAAPRAMGSLHRRHRRPTSTRRTTSSPGTARPPASSAG